MAERYQWTQGPYNGKIETVNCEDDNYIYFDSGRRCSKENLLTMMFQTTDSSEATPYSGSLNTFDDEINFGGGHDYSGDLGIKMNIPDDVKSEMTIVEKTANTAKQETPQIVAPQETIVIQKPKKEEKQSPIKMLLDMQNANSLVSKQQTITINFDWPSNDFIKILSTTFDSESVKNELTKYLLDQTSTDGIYELIKNMVSEEIDKVMNKQ